MIEELESIIEDNINHQKEALVQRNNFSIFFIDKKELEASESSEKKFDFSALKERLTIILSLSNAQCLQVIGDSNPFSEAGEKYLQGQLTKLFQEHDGPVLYGFTSNKQGGANGVVAKCIEQDEEQAKKIIANVVYNETIIAVKEWNCTYSNKVKNYLVVFDKDRGCHFGEDIYLSDNLAEKLCCAEGGIISFCQIVNTLLYHPNPNIILIHGLRDEKSTPWFSAAQFVEELSSEANSIAALRQIKETYLKGHKLYDPNGNPVSDAAINAKTEQVNTAFSKLVTLPTVLEKLKAIKTEKYSFRKPLFFRETCERNFEESVMINLSPN